MNKPTPTPWHVETSNRVSTIKTPDEKTVVLQQTDNARHIVTCVNAHAGLVGLAKATHEAIQQWRETGFPSLSLLEALQDSASSILSTLDVKP